MEEATRYAVDIMVYTNLVPRDRQNNVCKT